ncbi:MAG TPA: hypothetical protein PLP29_10200 [Candidatus Ozemobacteraceae bacterium]|nr:hypothetical protein [Candidatus Ozemobacteraceae bacterium]
MTIRLPIEFRRPFRGRTAFTLVEMIASMAVAFFIFLLIYKLLAGVRSHYMYGTVNLQNLQDARLAINYLRRDFASACPRFKSVTGASDGYLYVNRLRKNIFKDPPAWDPRYGDPIQVTPNGVAFFRFEFDAGARPNVEQVQYQFDAATKTLKRKYRGAERVFRGFETVEFRVYTHMVNPGVPLLWVRLLIHEGQQMYGSTNIGKPLELTTTISSNFVSSSLNHLTWNYETYHN